LLTKLFSPPLGFVEILEPVARLLCFFFNTYFNLITLLFELMAADNFCKVGVIGTDGEHAAVGVVEDDDEDDLVLGAVSGRGSNRQKVPEYTVS
jgi:hypothetical protein